MGDVSGEGLVEDGSTSSCSCVLSVRAEEEVKRSLRGRVGVCRGEMKGDGVVGEELGLHSGEQGDPWVILEGREVPPFHMTVSGVLLRLCVLLHALQRCMLVIQRSLRAGGPCKSACWAESDGCWPLVEFMCCHMCGCSCCSVTEFRST